MSNACFFKLHTYSRVNLENYEKIEVGMMPEEVAEILGYKETAEQNAAVMLLVNLLTGIEFQIVLLRLGLQTTELVQYFNLIFVKD